MQCLEVMHGHSLGHSMGLVPTVHTSGAVVCDLREGEKSTWQNRA